MDEKTAFILSSFSKIKHKKHELYCVTRIIHLLDDLDVEFKCQQLIRTGNGIRLVDLYFPQINIYVEINESQHFSSAAKLYDNLRSKDIYQSIGAQCIEIPTIGEVGSDLNVFELNKRIDEVVKQLQHIISKAKNSPKFVSWDTKLQSQYDHSNLRVLNISDNIAVRKQVDAINLFGVNYKGWRSGEWLVPNSQKSIWFPRFYEHNIWTNALSADGSLIYEQKTDNSKIDYSVDNRVRIVFGRFKDHFGKTIYIYTGEFKFLKEENSGSMRVYKRVGSKTTLPT